MALLECVANVSEGRRQAVIDEIGSAVRKAGARLLNVAPDADHHRTVFTFVGTRPVVEAAALALFAVAIPRIDLRTHRGVHPRIGAVDVVPFVPLDGAEMADCIGAARSVGAAVAQRHALPVFLYGEAAQTAARQRLERVRRGQFEGLAAKLLDDEWRPDFGPVVPHPSAGASAVGARDLLIAYNINLSTDRLAVATSIAATVRQSSGGLPFVKAMGVPLAARGLVQVSMNLTDYRQTSMAAVFAAVSKAAARAGVAVLESEVIGLVPEAALPAGGPAALQLARFDDHQILERALGRRSAL